MFWGQVSKSTCSLYLSLNCMKLLLVCLLSVVAMSAYSQTKMIVVQNQYYPKPGKEDEVYQCRLHGSEVRAKLGLAKGKVLTQTNDDGQTVVIWECEYQSLDDRKKDVASLEKSEEFKKIQEHMSTLVERFERKIREANLR